MRRKTIQAAMLVVLLVGLMTPLARMLSVGQDEGGDANHMIEPMLTLLLQSPQAKAATQVMPLMEMEAVWAIEDTREEADSLILGMRQGDNELGYDAQSRTFYCTLGLNIGGGVGLISPSMRRQPETTVICA